jgi:hypothetical protein
MIFHGDKSRREELAVHSRTLTLFLQVAEHRAFRIYVQEIDMRPLIRIPSQFGFQFSRLKNADLGLSIDKQGNFYTVDGLSIIKFSPDGRVLARWR